MNELAPAWAELRVEKIWSDASRHTSLIVARAPNASAISLHRLAGRMIALSEGGIPNFRLARPPVRTEVDGADALIYDYTGSPPFGLVKVRVALIRHGEDTHMVSLTSTPEAFAAESPRFADVLDAWEWS